MSTPSNTPPPSLSPAPHQLPPVLANFAGRTPDLGALDTMLGRKPGNAPLLLVVNGPPGVGKTTLVSAWLHTVAEEFPDGQMYADLRGHSAERPGQPAEILGQFLRALGAASVPAGASEQVSLWRSLTAGLRLAVMLDNAFSAAQVRPLLPGGPGNVTVVTSRNRLTGLGVDGARFHPLRVLGTGAGLELLASGIGAQRVAAEPAAARRVAELCGGLPLALCLAAARLAARPRQPVQSMADALARDAGPLAVLTVEGETAVRSALDLSYAAVSDGAARLYRRLGVLPTGTFDTRVCAAAGALPVDEAELLLDELIEANLLEDSGPGPDTCRFHDLVREHARERAAAEDGSGQTAAESIRRVCELHLATATAAEQLLTPEQLVLSRDYAYPTGEPAGFGGEAQALHWLDTQRQNLMACVRAAAEHGWYDTGWQLVDACWPLFLRLRPYDLWIEAHEIGLDCARRSRHREQREAERQMLNSGAIGLTAAGRTGTAIAWYEDALAAARAAGDTRDEGQALHGLGTCHHDAGRPEEAAAFLHRAIDTWQSCGYERGVGLSLIVLGEVLLGTRQPAEAIDRLTRAHGILTDVHDSHSTARALALRGRARVVAGDHEAGVRELDRALGVFSAAGTLYWQGRTLEMLGDSALERGDRAAALDHFQQAITRYETTGPTDARRVRERLSEVPGRE
ncbi:tetratricopeptide repeat protein [Streptomyces sp. TS71-3]|uniref:tetratricopeptide repeat protein n=1 Tax=Streptomyces sp. TS71-3 TaxID=2733862 RepID=UPI00201818A3|nr:tetratricopeptide repeat protein [Streptomyces sp. TS71-3]